MRVQVIRAWPRRSEAMELQLDDGATVADAIKASGFGLDGISGYAIHGERVVPTQVLRDRDRIELLRPLQADPKEARRRRAAASKRS